MSVESTNSERVQSMSEVLSTIDLGPTGSVQFRFAKLQMAQAELCKQQADGYMDKIEQIQADQEEVAKMISMARDLQQKAKDGQGDCSWDDKASIMPQEMIDYFNKHGLTYDKTGNDAVHNEDEWDIAIKSLTNHQETIGTETQTLMVYLQDFIGQYNSYTQGASSQISSATQTLTNIARGQ